MSEILQLIERIYFLNFFVSLDSQTIALLTNPDLLIFISGHIVSIRRTCCTNKNATISTMMSPSENTFKFLHTDTTLLGLIIRIPSNRIIYKMSTCQGLVQKVRMVVALTIWS